MRHRIVLKDAHGDRDHCQQAISASRHGCGAHQHTFARDVAFGLTAPQKWLPPKYFYDERGSRLYEQICGLREYYLYRAELEILSTYATEIHAEIGRLALVELGSGNATKTRHLLTAYERARRPFRYCPVDISREILLGTADRLVQEYSHIDIRAMHADFAKQPEVIQAFQLEKKAVAFLGSTLGNFTPEESAEFLRRTAAILGPDDAFLLGVDLKKSPAILVPAYDDAQGITAAFNLNVLHRINYELGGRFTRKGLSTWPFTMLSEGVLRCTSAAGWLSTYRLSRSSKPCRFAKTKLFIRKVRTSTPRTKSVT